MFKVSQALEAAAEEKKLAVTSAYSAHVHGAQKERNHYKKLTIEVREDIQPH